MKKLLIVLALTLIALCTVHAQPEKGMILLEGRVNYSVVNTDNEFTSNFSPINRGSKNNSLTIGPSIGFFLSNSTLIGIGLSFRRNSYREIDTFGPRDILSAKELVVSLHPRVAKYYNLTEKLYLVPELNARVGIGNSELEAGDVFETDILEFGTSLTVGLTYFISDNWAISVSNFGGLSYSYTRQKNGMPNGVSLDPKNTETNFGLDIGLGNLFFGFQYLIRKE